MIDIFGALLEIVSPTVILCVVIGTVVGLIASGLPGVAGSLAVIVLLPFTVQLNLYEGLGLLIGAYKAVNFGGVLPAAGLGIPGSPEAAAATPDLYALTKKGYPRKGLGVALQAGTIGDLTSNLITAILLPLLGVIALALGAREMFVIGILALIIVPTAITGRAIPASIAVALGLLMSLVGPDPIFGSPRLTFGWGVLRDGFGIVPLVVGLLAMTVIIEQIVEVQRFRRTGQALPVLTSAKDDRVSWRNLKGTWRELTVGSLLGAALGILPGAGSTMAAYSAYGVTGRFARNLGKYGKGSVRAIAAAESANNATVGPSFVPLLALGIPGGALAAIIAGAFILQGVTPGPSMFQRSPEIIVGFLGLLGVATIVNYPLGKLFIYAYRFVPRISPTALMPIVGVMLLVATYSYQNSLNDVLIMLMLGVFGYVLTRIGIPTAPLVVAFIIGPLVETHLRRALRAGGSWEYLFSGPVAIGLWIVAALILGYLAVSTFRRSRRLPDAAQQREEAEADRTGD